MRFRYRLLSLAATVVAGCLIGGAASAQAIYLENFEDEMLEENTMVSDNATIQNGNLMLDDAEPTNRSTFSVVQDFTDPVLTFSFDIVEPIVEGEGIRYELLIRAGIGDAHNTLSNADHIVEAIIFRGGNRGAYTNNGNETIFLVANNQDVPITFASPIDGADVMLNGFQYIPYVVNNDTGVFGEIKGISNFRVENTANFGTFNRFAIGSSTNGDVGTVSIDNVLVTEGATFERDLNLGVPGDVDGDMDVDMDDYLIIQNNFQNAATERAEGDLNRNGVVDLVDFRLWKNNFPTAAPTPPGVGSAVPEPSAALLMVCGVIGLWSSRRRNRAAA